MKPFPPRCLLRLILAFCMAISLLASCSLAQTSTSATTAAKTPPATCAPTPTPWKLTPQSTQPQLPPCRVKRHTDTSISLGALTQLTTARTQDLRYNYFVQDTAPSAGTLGTFRQTFSPWLGYSVNLGYSRVSEHYRGNDVSSDSGEYVDGFNVGANMYESSITYIAHTRVNKRYSLFGDVGPGLLTFLPIHRGPDAINYVPFQYYYLVPGVQVRPAGVFGSGIDLHLGGPFDLRAEYRGLLYKNPDFNTGDAPYLKLLTLTSEPTVSLVYHLHKPKPQPEFPEARPASH